MSTLSVSAAPGRRRMAAARGLLVLCTAGVVAMGGAVTWAWLDGTGGGRFLRNHPWQACTGLVLVAVLTTFNLVIRWLRWGFLLRRCDVRMPTRDTARLFLVTLPALLTPLYLGELVRVAIVRRHAPRVGPVLFTVWITERLSDVGALLWLWGLADGQLSLVLAGVALLGLSPWVLSSRVGTTSANASGLARKPPITALVVCPLLSILAWTLPGIGTWAVLHLFAAGAEPQLAMTAFARGTLLGGLTGLPAGIAVSGSASIRALVESSVAPAAAAATVAIVRAATTWYAVALGSVLLLVWRRHIVRIVRGPVVQQHFDELSSSYADEIPEHVRHRLLERKLGAMAAHLVEPSEGRAVSGLDIGCGHGWYAVELARRGWSMAGTDRSAGQLAQARAHGLAQGVQLDLRQGDGVRLPFETGTFDFAYSINMFHHLTTAESQRAMLREVVRVLKPGGVFFLHEMNTENPLFRLYMSYVFPLLTSIDEGTELWMRPSHLPPVVGADWSPDIDYFTFLPDFLPDAVLRFLLPIEAQLERSAFRRYSAHYVGILRASPVGSE